MRLLSGSEQVCREQRGSRLKAFCKLSSKLDVIVTAAVTLMPPVLVEFIDSVCELEH